MLTTLKRLLGLEPYEYTRRSRDERPAKHDPWDGSAAP